MKMKDVFKDSHQQAIDELQQMKEFYSCRCSGAFVCTPCLILACAINRIVGIQNERVDFFEQRSKDSIEIRELRKIKTKAEHGCYDAYCKTCDG